MEKKSTDLSSYNNSWYKPGSKLKRALWFFINVVFLQNPVFGISACKKFWLKLFGAKIGKGVVIKNAVNIKYPWMLEIGNHVWIGEKVWIDNLAPVKIGDHCCLSQGAFLLCGNHDFSKTSFDLIVKPITLENGVWIGAKAIVGPGVTCHSHSVLSAGSFTSRNLKAYTIYRGNPAEAVAERKIS